MTTPAQTPPTTDDKPKTKDPEELIRFGFNTKRMPLTKFLALVDVAEAPDGSTIRLYNGSAIIEAPPEEAITS